METNEKSIAGETRKALARNFGGGENCTYITPGEDVMFSVCRQYSGGLFKSRILHIGADIIICIPNSMPI